MVIAGIILIGISGVLVALVYHYLHYPAVFLAARNGDPAIRMVLVAIYCAVLLPGAAGLNLLVFLSG